MNVYAGPSFASDAFVVVEPDRARSATSRSARRCRRRSTARPTSTRSTRARRELPRTLANPGTWGYERDVFQKDWNALPEPTQDVREGQAAGQAGGRDRQDDRHRHVAARSTRCRPRPTPIRQAAISVGLKAKLKSVSAGQLHQLLHRPQGAQGRRRLPDRQLPRLRRPGRALQHVRRAGRQPELRRLRATRGSRRRSNDARTTTDQRTRAELTAEAGDLIMQTLPLDPAGGTRHGGDHGQEDHRRAVVLPVHGRARGPRTIGGSERLARGRCCRFVAPPAGDARR